MLRCLGQFQAFDNTEVYDGLNKLLVTNILPGTLYSTGDQWLIDTSMDQVGLLGIEDEDDI